MRPFLCGSVAAVIGAAIWAFLIAALQVEIAIAAWAIGGIIGFAASVGGARGGSGGAMAAGLTIVAICLGKIIGSSILFNAEVDKMVDSVAEPSVYQELQKDAADFAVLSGASAYPQFMVTHNYTQATSAAQVTREELDGFTTHEVPVLQSFQTKYPTYEAWRAHQAAEMKKIAGQMVSYTDMLKNSMGLMDVLFFCLGVVTAFRLAVQEDI